MAANDNKGGGFASLVKALTSVLSDLGAELVLRRRDEPDEDLARLEALVAEVKAALAKVEAAERGDE